MNNPPGGLTIEPLTGNTGALVHGVDLRDVADEVHAALHQALLDHLVLFFPGQSLTMTEQLAFGRLLGEVEVPPFGPGHPDLPEMTVLDQHAPKGNGTDAWHSDNTFRAEPPKFTMLQAEQLPPTGGDTCWSNMYEAFDTLSGPLQRLLDGLTATHDLTKILELTIANGHSGGADLAAMRAAFPPMSHPVVRTHPETGRKALFVNGNFTTKIDQLGDAESRRVLDHLYDHIQTPDFQCRFHWTPGALALWDNRCLQHYAVPDYEDRRVMHRLIIRGEQPA
ncbi:MAG: TauD/TfdA family dioxygenase [Acidimicrobiales bacterium]